MPRKGIYQRGNVWWCCYKGWDGSIQRVSAKTPDRNEAAKFLHKRIDEVNATDFEGMKRSCERTSLRGRLTLAKLEVAILEKKLREAEYESDRANVQGKQRPNEENYDGEFQGR